MVETNPAVVVSGVTVALPHVAIVVGGRDGRSAAAVAAVVADLSGLRDEILEKTDKKLEYRSIRRI